jgi:hypothetical protein
VRKPQVPRLGVAESYITGTPTPEQVLAASRLLGLCVVVVVALLPAWIPWLSSPRRAPRLGPNPAPSHGRELGVDLRRRDCHTRFYKENRMHLTCAPGSIYTHMIDKTSVIPLQ